MSIKIKTYYELIPDFKKKSIKDENIQNRITFQRFWLILSISINKEFF